MRRAWIATQVLFGMYIVWTFPGWHLDVLIGRTLKNGVQYDHTIGLAMSWKRDRKMVLPNKKLTLHIADPATIHAKCDCFGAQCKGATKDNGDTQTEDARAGGCEVEHESGWTDIWMVEGALVDTAYHELCHWDGSIPRNKCDEQWPWRD